MDTIDPRLRLCTRCHSITRPTVARLAWGMLTAWLVMFVFLVLSVATAGHTPVLDLLFLGAIFHPRVCRRCQSTKVIPLDTPEGKRLTPQALDAMP